MILSVYLCVCVASVLTSFETCNKYQVKNSLGQQVYFAGEGLSLPVYSSVCLSVCLCLPLVGNCMPAFSWFWN